MEYVEALRARRILTWYAGILYGLLALALFFVFKDGGAHVQASPGKQPHVTIAEMFAGAAFLPLVLAAFLGVGLDAEYKTTAIVWTRPLGRIAIAGRYIAIDAAAMFVAWLLTLVAAFIPVFALGLQKFIVYGTDAAVYVPLALGCAAMWYGLIVLVAALFPGRAAAVAGISWAYALIVPGFASVGLPPVLHAAAVGLNYLNPLAYLGSIGSAGGSTHSHALIAGSLEQHAVAVWIIGIVATAAGARIWATREVSA